MGDNPCVSSNLPSRFFVYFSALLFYHAIYESVCDKSNPTNNSIELGKGHIHSGVTLTAVFAMTESPKFHQITKKTRSTNLVSKKGKIGWHREAQHTQCCFENTEKR